MGMSAPAANSGKNQSCCGPRVQRGCSLAEDWEHPQQARGRSAPSCACAALLLPQCPTGELRSLRPAWASHGGTEGAGSPLSNYLKKNACCEAPGMDPGLHMGVDCLPVPDATVTCTSPCLSQLVTSSLQSLGEHGAILPDVSEMLCTSSRMVLEVCLCYRLQHSNTPPPKLLFPALHRNLPSPQPEVWFLLGGTSQRGEVAAWRGQAERLGCRARFFSVSFPGLPFKDVTVVYKWK